MQFTINTPNVIGHVIESRHDAGEAPFFGDERTALCGAEVKGQVEGRRYVCGKCVAALIADRNRVNRSLDRADRVRDLLMERIEVVEDINERLIDSIGPAAEAVVSGETSGGDEPEPGSEGA